MLASTGPFRTRRPLSPGRLYGTDIPASAHGITTQPLQARELVGRQRRVGRAEVDGASGDLCDAGTEPVAEYVILIPSAWSTAGIHFEMSGNGKVAPVPDERARLRASPTPLASCRHSSDGDHDDDCEPSTSARVSVLPASSSLLSFLSHV